MFTLRDPKRFGTARTATVSTERTGLLPVRHVANSSGRLQMLVIYVKEAPFLFWNFATSPHGIDVWKCTLAYFLATLVVFIPQATHWFGPSGNQVAANIVVWFSPNRTIGSMQKSIVGALIAFIWAAAIDYAAMGISYAMHSRGLLEAAHVIILIFFVGGGFGIIAYVKQKYSDSIVNVSCSLASLGIGALVTVGAIQNGEWSGELVYHILQMTVVAMLVSTLVCVLIHPTFAKTKLRENIAKTTSGFSAMLTAITVSFLTGDERELELHVVLEAAERLKDAYSALEPMLEEAKWEYYFLGTERRYHLGKRLVKCLQQLSQDLGGLRSAATTQFELLAEIDNQASEAIAFRTHRASTVLSPTFFAATYQPRNSFSLRYEEASFQASEEALPPMHRPTAFTRPPVEEVAATNAHRIFWIFIEHLGPLMKSLAYTLKQIHDEPPFDSTPEQPVSYHPVFRSSLADAIELYSKSRKEALELVYKSKEITLTKSIQVAADFEEVAASCGHFSSSLEDFADHTLTYLDILGELDQTMYNHSRSWRWIYERGAPSLKIDNETTPALVLKSGTTMHIPSTSTAHGFALFSSVSFEKDTLLALRKSIWRHLHVFRRDDVKYSIKVGLAGLLLGMLSYIKKTRDVYQTWSMQWAALAYMIFCCMTVGASVNTSIQRVIGTLQGGLISLIIWYIAGDNPYVLAFFGLPVSAVAWYYVVEKNEGPQGRFVLLTYNLIVLYSYAASKSEPTGTGAASAPILLISLRRVVSILIGCCWGVLVTRFIWPISARRKIRTGLSLLYLRCSLIWRKAPVPTIVGELDHRGPLNPYMDLRDETKLRTYSDSLDAIRISAESEYKLRGPFPTDSFKELLESANRALDALHALNVVIEKDNKASPGEAAILKYTSDEREALAGRISHLFSGMTSHRLFVTWKLLTKSSFLVLAASVQLKYAFPTASLPNVQNARDKLLAKVFQFRKENIGNKVATDEDFELLYCYALVTGQTAKELYTSFRVLDKLYGLPDEDILKLQ